jgi:stringent starvation protein B
LPELSQRPYLLRAMLEWIVDNGWTPLLIVDARSEAVQVPVKYVTEGFIRLNISASATRDFRIDADVVEFNARFGGVGHHVRVPIEQVLAIVARENEQGMAFRSETRVGEGVVEAGANAPADAGNEANPPAEPPTPPTAPDRPKRPSLKIVK